MGQKEKMLEGKDAGPSSPCVSANLGEGLKLNDMMMGSCREDGPEKTSGESGKTTDPGKVNLSLAHSCSTCEVQGWASRVPVGFGGLWLCCMVSTEWLRYVKILNMYILRILFIYF